MNFQKLKLKAVMLRAEIEFLKKSVPAAAILEAELGPLITSAESGNIIDAVEWRDIPGEYLFTECGLQEFRNLEDAYSEFCIELTGGESLAFLWLKKEMDKGGSD